MKHLFLVIILLSVNLFQVDAHEYSVRGYGAQGDGKTNDTKAIQAAIDQAATEGGGVVLFPPGQYVSGSIILKNYVVLRFEAGSILLGSLDIKDYPEDLGVLGIGGDYVWKGPLIYAENARYIGIEGTGIIDGRGTRESFPPFPRTNQRPGLIRFKDCQFVTVRDVTMRNSACWTFHLRNCEDVVVRDIRLDSNVNRNNDGIDVDGGKRISITGCNINSEDDAIVLKSFNRETVSDIIISDCILTSTCSAIKIGTETVGDFSNISISNCAIYGSRGINLFSVDGADINNVTISNISMRDSKSAIQLRLGARMRPYALPKDQQLTRPGRVRNIMISNVQAVIGHGQTSTGVDNSQNFISGIPDHHIENVCMSNIYISFYGNGTVKQAQREIPEEISTYPKIGMFGDLPAYGFFIRHVDGIKLHNVHLDVLNEDLRPAIVFDQVSGIDLYGCLLKGNQSGEPLIKLSNVNDVIIRDCRPDNKIRTFVGVSGKGSKGIILQNNILQKAKNMTELGKEVKSDVVKEVGTMH
jgi:polygalacturonase